MSLLSERVGVKELSIMISETLQKIVDANIGITNINAGSVVRTLVESILGNNDETNYYIEYVYKSLGLEDAIDYDLDRLLQILSITRNDAENAIGVVEFSTGEDPYLYDIVIPFGYTISTRQNNDGKVIEFSVTDTNAILPAGSTSLSVNVKAVEPGELYLPAGTLIVMNSSIVGIQSVTNTTEINSGKNKETDDEFRLRSKEVMKSNGKCTSNAIKYSIEQIDGVNTCTIYDMIDGVGTVGIVVATEILPPPTELQTVIESTVSSVKSAGVFTRIIYPTIKNISISVTITTPITISDNTVIKAISDYVNSLEINQPFIIKQMEKSVLNILGENSDITTLLPTVNVTAGSTEIIKVTSIIINGVTHNV